MAGDDDNDGEGIDNAPAGNVASQVQGIVNASAEDKDAFFKAYAASLDSVRFRAEKWATILSALTAIFAIVTPFASPTDFKDLEDGPQIAIGVSYSWH
jgi:hypothetical protein